MAFSSHALIFWTRPDLNPRLTPKDLYDICTRNSLKILTSNFDRPTSSFNFMYKLVQNRAARSIWCKKRVHEKKLAQANMPDVPVSRLRVILKTAL